MFGFLSFLLVLFLLIIFIGFTILCSILRLFGMGKFTFNYQRNTSTNPKQNTYTQNQTNDKHENIENSSSSSNRPSHSSGSRKKIFDDDEGEYVDYEEVK